jgi:hypothetical protein
MMKNFLSFAAKVIILHTVTYFVAGIISATLNDYESVFQMPVVNGFMRSFNSKWVLCGPLFQPLRGLVYALGLWPFRTFILSKKHGWLYIWSLFVVFAIIGTSGAAPGSMEGIIFTQLPLWFHFIGMPEILLQTLAFSLLLFYWDRRNERRRQVKHASHSK